MFRRYFRSAIQKGKLLTLKKKQGPRRHTINVDGAVTNLILARSNVQTRFVADAHRGHFRQPHVTVLVGLIPQYFREVFDPGVLGLQVERLQGPDLTASALSVPDFKSEVTLGH